MKTGKSLSALAAELERQVEAKRDYIAPTVKLSMVVAKDQPDTNPVRLEGVNGGMPLKPIAHTQLASALGIPKAYYDRMLAEAPDLVCANVNVWMKLSSSKKLVRTIDGQIRAVLSDSYRPLDNYQLAEAVLPRLQQLEAKVVSSELTESRMYIKAVTERIKGEIKVGDAIQAGLVVSNSEVGMGRLEISEMTYRLVCLNGAIHDSVVKKTHVGRASHGHDALEDAREYFRNETRIADDHAFFLKVQDATGAVLNQERLDKRLIEYQRAAGMAIPEAADPVEVVEVTAQRFGLQDGERKSVLKNLIQGGDLSLWGMANAVTATAKEDAINYDRATELESLGARIVELPKHEWDRLVKVN